MRILIELLLIGGLLTGVGFYFTQKHIRASKIAKVLKEAYFQGGPLDNQTHKLKSLPNTYLFGDAVYRHDGGGIYTFQDYLNDGASVIQEIEGWEA